MKDREKTKVQLLEELRAVRGRMAELEASETAPREAEESLRRMNEEQRRVLDAVPATIWYKDTENRLLRVNKAVADALGMAVEDIEGKSCYELFPDEAERYYEDDMEVITSGKPKQGIVEPLQTASGEKRWVQTDKIPYRNEQGDIAGVIVFAVDITERKRAEIEVEQRRSILEAINRVFRETISGQTEEELARTCLRVAEELTGSKFGFMGEVNPSNRYDTIALSNPGWDACRMPGSKAGMLIQNMEIRGIWGAVIKEERSLIVNDPDGHSDRVGTPDGHPPLTCFLGVPLKDGGRTVGMIALANKEGGYDAADQEAVEALSVSIMEAMKRKRMEDMLARQTEEILEISTPVMEVWTGVVVAPLIGTLDSRRSQRFMEVLLERIVETNSSVALVDITGVPAIDTQTAQHLIETITAVRLLGAQVVLTGVRPAIAQTLVHLGIGLSDIVTRSSLSAGLRVAMDMLNVQMKRTDGDR